MITKLPLLVLLLLPLSCVDLRIQQAAGREVAAGHTLTPDVNADIIGINVADDRVVHEATTPDYYE